MGTFPEPTPDSVENAVIKTIRSVKRGVYDGTKYDRFVPSNVAAEAWRDHGYDEQWGIEWENALKRAERSQRIGTDQVEGQERVGVFA